MSTERDAVVVASIALSLDTLVYGLAVPILPVITATLGVSTGTIGALFGVYAAASLVTTPLAGAWVDRVGPRWPMITGLVGLAAATVIFAHAGSLATLVLARACQGAAAALSWTGGLTLVAATHAPDRRGAALGTALGATGLGTLAGPPLGGWLFQLGGPRLPFLATAALALGGAVVCALRVSPAPYPRSDTSARQVLATPGIGPALLVTAAGASIVAALEPVLPLRMAAQLGASPPLVGAIFGAATLASSLAFPLAGKLASRGTAQRVVGAGGLLAAAGLLLLARAASVASCGLGLGTVAVGNALILAPTSAVMSQVAESHTPPAYGTTYALYTIAYSVGLALGPLLSAAGVAQAGWGPSLGTGAALLGVVAGALLVTARRGALSAEG